MHRPVRSIAAGLVAGWGSVAASAALPACGPSSSADLSSISATADLAVVPSTVDGTPVSLPAVRAKVGDRTLLALIDTGSSGVVVSSKLYGVDDGSLIELPSVCLGEVCSQALEALARETPFSTVSGIQMIVGMSVLRHQTLEIDHALRVRLGALPTGCSAQALPLVLDAWSRPFVDAIQVAGSSAPNALVDTGSVYSLLDAPSSASLPAAVLAGATATSFCNIDGCTPGAFVITSPSMCMGASCSTNVAIKYPAYVGVGMSFLSRYRVLFDFSKGSVQLCDESAVPIDGGASAGSESGD
jgi:hypothetical protein